MQTEVVQSLSAKIVSSSEMIKLSQYILATALPYPLLIAFCIHIHVHDAASLTVLWYFYFAIDQLSAPLVAAALYVYSPFFIISCGFRLALTSNDAFCLLIGKPK